MPLFFQHTINQNTRLAIWKIEEEESFFLSKVPVKRDVSHPHKRLQHLAGRYLLPLLFDDFPLEEILIADTRKPFLPDEKYHFSISHCGDFAAAVASSKQRVGIDIELVTATVEKIQHKFLNEDERPYDIPGLKGNRELLTILWSAKEAVFKWYGNGEVDFRKHILLNSIRTEKKVIDCRFVKTNSDLHIHFKEFDELVLAWVAS